jgi:hypothetical protein
MNNEFSIQFFQRFTTELLLIAFPANTGILKADGGWLIVTTGAGAAAYEHPNRFRTDPRAYILVFLAHYEWNEENDHTVFDMIKEANRIVIAASGVANIKLSPYQLN